MMSDVPNANLIALCRSHANTLRDSADWTSAGLLTRLADALEAVTIPTSESGDTLHAAIQETVVLWEDTGGNIEHMLQARLARFRTPIPAVPTSADREDIAETIWGATKLGQEVMRWNQLKDLADTNPQSTAAHEVAVTYERADAVLARFCLPVTVPSECVREQIALWIEGKTIDGVYPDFCNEYEIAEAIRALPLSGRSATADCEHCIDGHRSPLSRPWAAWVGAERDSDGQPTHVRVAPTAGQHVAESDAEWLRDLIRGAVPVEQSRPERKAMIEAAVSSIARNFTNETAAWNAWNSLTTTPEFVTAIVTIHGTAAPVPVEPGAAGMENARILGRWLFENYPSSEPDIAVVALAVLKSLSAVPVEPECQDYSWLDPTTGVRFSKQNDLTLGYVYAPVEHVQVDPQPHDFTQFTEGGTQ